MAHPSFELIHTRPIASLNLEVQEYRHRVTGARHLHLAADDAHNAFLVAFLTVPQDSTGVAHILEHTALCGSQHYPVRDPFFMMIRRSLNTFMNAFTSSDWTAYPFASQNHKDFNNLLDVYLDAAFFPLLNELDFAQEGHRVGFAVPDDPNSGLVFKGVVYNEMKGAMSSAISRLAQTLQSHLFPTITYHHNSGGDPEYIPDLTYEQLKTFHARHYHPSNAIFMTYGDIPAHEHQGRFEERALTHFQAQSLDFSIPNERRYSSPMTATASYPLDEEDTQDKTHIVLGWLLDKDINPHEVLRAQILSDVLLDNSSSPLRRALETTKLGTSPSPLCGFDDSTRETTFVCGLEGSNPEQAQAVEELVLRVIGEVAEHGVPQEVLESVLHQLELRQREITGEGFPYGLRLMLDALPPALHGGDPVAALDIDPLLESLREEIRQPGFIQNLAGRLLDNPHRVRLVMTPDPTLSTRQAEAEARRLAELRAKMSDADLSRIIARTRALQARQAQEDDPEILPKVGLEDIPTELKIPEGHARSVASLPATWFVQGTNGMVYQQLIMDLPDLDEESLDLLPLVSMCMTEVGSGGRDYLQTQALQAAATGGVGARSLIKGDVDDVQQLRGIKVLSGKALARNHAAMAQLLRETLETARFDELERLRELIAQLRAQREEGLTDHGHLLAMAAASANLNPTSALAHRWDGLQGLQTLQALDDALDKEEELASFAARLATLRDRLITVRPQLLLVSEADQQETMTRDLENYWRDHQGSSPTGAGFNLRPVNVPPTPIRQGWVINTQINFCAQAYPTVPTNHPDAPALLVLGNFLKNGFLHRAIREQGGAYGAGASYQGDTGVFRFFSYRDPRLAETLEDFQRSLTWLRDTDHPPRALEEAILGVIAAIDRPGSPAGEAINTFLGTLFGRTPEQRRTFRQQVLTVKLEDLQRVAETYLLPERANIAVLSNGGILKKQAAALDLEIKAL